MLRILTPWDSQPQEAVQPAIEGIVSVINPAIGRFDYVGNVALSSSSGSPSATVTQAGRAFSVAGSQASYYGTVSPRQIATGAVSILTVFTATSGATDFGSIGGITYTNTNTAPYVYAEIKRGGLGSGSNVRLMLNWNAGGVDAKLVSATTIVAGKTYAVLASATAGAQAVYIAELIGLGSVFLEKVTSSTAGAMTALATARLEIGDSFNARAPAAEVALQVIFDRVLSDSEARSCLSSPWQLFAPRSIWVPVSAGAGGAYTLTALAGAYTVAGQSATLVRGRSAAAAAGAYSLSGQAASLSIGHTLTAAAGAYSLSGQSATLVRGRVLAAGAGAYSLSGQNATITYTPAGSYTLTANAGAYTLSGQATTIAWGRALAAASGSYALSGQAATITYAPANAYTLTCVAGAYAISGQAATVTWSGEAVTTTLRRGFAGFPRSHLWIAHINGKRYVGTYEELEEALGEVVEKTARKPRVVIKSGRVVSRGVAQPAVATVEQAKIVQQQLTVDIGPLLAAAVRRRDEEEEEDLMLLL